MITGTKHGYIYDVLVKENHRRKGVGVMLMKRAEHYCRRERLQGDAVDGFHQ